MRNSCTNKLEPRTLESISGSDGKYLVRINCMGEYQCYDIRALLQWIDDGNRPYPLCDIEISNMS